MILEKICLWKQVSLHDPLKEIEDLIEESNRTRSCYECDGKDLNCNAYVEIYRRKK